MFDMVSVLFFPGITVMMWYVAKATAFYIKGLLASNFCDILYEKNARGHREHFLPLYHGPV